jgi:hypothetical protein
MLSTPCVLGVATSVARCVAVAFGAPESRSAGRRWQFGDHDPAKGGHLRRQRGGEQPFAERGEGATDVGRIEPPLQAHDHRIAGSGPGCVDDRRPYTSLLVQDGGGPARLVNVQAGVQGREFCFRQAVVQ